MVNIKVELLNSKTEWHQPKIVRTTIHTIRRKARALSASSLLGNPQGDQQEKEMVNSVDLSIVNLNPVILL